MKKNGFLTFIFACVPGCGQMYQGYMKRGVSLLFWAAFTIAFVVFSRLLPLIFLLFVIWAYSFFDAFNLRNLTVEQRALFEDNYIPNLKAMNITGFESLQKNMRLSKVLGWGAIILGALVLLYNLYNVLLDILWQFAPTLAEWLWRGSELFTGLAVGVLVILLGLRLLRGQGKARVKQAQPEPELEEEIPEFKGENNDD